MIHVLEANACHHIISLQITTAVLKIQCQGKTEDKEMTGGVKVKMTGGGQLDQHIHCCNAGKQTLHSSKQGRKEDRETYSLIFFPLSEHSSDRTNEAHKRISVGFWQLPSCQDFGRTPAPFLHRLFFSLFIQNQSRLARD